MRGFRSLAVVLPIVASFAGPVVGEGTAQVAQVEPAHRVEDYAGVNNLFFDGSLYFGGQPDAASLRRLAAEGVRTVVNLRGPSELASLSFDEAMLAGELGLEYVNIPVSPASFSTEDVDAVARVLAAAEGLVLIHCASSNRVGGVWAAYLVRNQGVDLETAIDLGKAAGLQSDGMIQAARRVAIAP